MHAAELTATTTMAAVANGFQSPYPVHAHGKTCGNPYEIPVPSVLPAEPEIFNTYTPHCASFR